MEENGLRSVVLNVRYSAIILVKRITGVIALILVGTSFVLFGCSLPVSANTAPSDSSSLIAQVATNNPNATPTPTLTPMEEPTPAPTKTPVPELSLKEEMNLLEIKNPEEKANVSTFLLAIYSASDENNIDKNFVTPVFFNCSDESKKRIWSFYDYYTEELLFSCESSLEIDSCTDVFLLNLAAHSDLSGLNNIRLIFITGIDEVNFDYVNRTYGMQFNVTDWVKEISILSDPQRWSHEESIYEYAIHYIEIVPKNLRAGSNTFKEMSSAKTPIAEPSINQS